MVPPLRATLAPSRLTNAAAQLVLRTQVRRKEKRPHTTPHRSRPYATWNPGPRFWVEPLIRKETPLPPLSLTSFEYYRNPHL